ncbi:MAG TPA: hypothetical protein VJ976_06385 [Ornithinimicrobium sp.]|uniref:hypothetical protein n=1 Tax=Ornithinimicrobium sp. TaxID=1977084 RepID=UPI002B4A45A3|nr:hypothetical protein [Ornithinimicrobium sp.]HKJ12002.1 hypothetical protein [Ornithinimicrobium sp.]
MIAWMSESEGGEHVTEHANELLFEPIWFGVISAVVFLVLLAMLWTFRHTLALDPHTEESASPEAAHGQRSSDGTSAQGQASQH